MLPVIIRRVFLALALDSMPLLGNSEGAIQDEEIYLSVLFSDVAFSAGLVHAPIIPTFKMN